MKLILKHPLVRFVILWGSLWALIHYLTDEHWLATGLSALLISVFVGSAYILYLLLNGPQHLNEFMKFWENRGSAADEPRFTDEASQPDQRETELPESETNEPTDSSQNKAVTDEQVMDRPVRTFSDKEKEVFNKFRDWGLIAHSGAMLDLFAHIETFASTDIEVLITGETGTGKENIARAIHELSSRSSGPFVAINCAGLTNSLLESELFGIEKGVATGVSAREGKFESAVGGTLFLDEIGDMPAGMQATVLRALQEKKITRVGSNKEIDIDVRFISATNKNLDKAVKSGQFRADLLSRIKKAPIVAPPLRERKQDIPYLAEYFYRRESHKLDLSIDIPIKYFGELTTRDWKGNVRDLESHIELLATVIHKHGQPQDHRRLRRIISDPKAYLSEHPESHELILRIEDDWNLLQQIVDADFNISRTADRIGKDRDSVTRRTSSICLRLGHHFGHDEERIISYLSSQGFLPVSEAGNFKIFLQKNWKTAIRFRKNPTTKPSFYADEEEMVQDLMLKKPDLG